MTQPVSGGQLVVDCLVAQGVTTSFGVPGESYLHVLDGLYEASDQLRFVCCRNEGGASYMAEAWGKLTGRPGICFVTRGPGACNAAVGVHTAMQDSSPMILFVGQVSTTSRQREAFQEIDYRAMFGSLAKWVTEIDDADRIPEVIARAFATAVSGRPGPVVVALPVDVLASHTTARPAGRVRIAEPAPSQADIDEALGLLGSASRPLVLVGGHLDESTSVALQQFADANDLPVATVFRFHDTFDNHSRCYIGDAGVAMSPVVSEAISNADVILALGIRFGEMTTAGFSLIESPDPEQTIIHTHASSSELGKIYQASLPINASTRRVVAALATRQLPHDDKRAAELALSRARFMATLETPPQPGALDMGDVMAWLRANLPDNAIITHGAGNFTIWPNKKFLYGRRQRLLATQNGTMGYGIPASIAAKIACPDRTVVCIAGDGDFQMNCQELGSSAQAGAQPIIIVIDNGMYGTIRMHQERRFPGRVSGTNLTNPDFVALAKAYGFHAERVTATSQFADAFVRATASPDGALLHLVIGSEMLTPTQSIEQARAAAGGQPG